MNWMKTTNQDVITNAEIAQISQLLCGTGLIGGHIDHDKSLFELGVVYDHMTGLCIICHESYKWPHMSATGKLQFGMKTIRMEEIDAEVDQYLDELLEYEKLTKDEWNSFGYGRRLFHMQQFNAWLTSASMIFFKEHSIGDLVSFLEKYQDEHYSHFKADADFMSDSFEGPEWGDDDGGLTIEEITEN